MSQAPSNHYKYPFSIGALLVSASFLFLFSSDAQATSLAAADPHLGYGANLADLSHTNYLQDLSFDWLVSYLYWSSAEPSNNNYNWADLNNMLAAAQNSGRKLILRVSGAPNWAWLGSGNPPLDLDQFAEFMGKVAERGEGIVAAYVIWNEPNLPVEWDGRSPQPSWYANMLKKVYPAIKAADAAAIVVAAGMATVGGDGCPSGISASSIQSAFTQAMISAGAVSDLQFITGIYQNGAKDFFDVLGTHPYGFAYSPETNPCDVNSLAFRRTEQQRAVMVNNGDGDKAMWAIEFGWILNPGNSCQNTYDWSTRWWQRVSLDTQADYLVRAYQYAFDNWPWMGVMNAFNLDFGTVYWYNFCDPIRWYSVSYRQNPADPANNPIQFWPGYDALKNMPRNTPSAPAAISGLVMDNRADPVAGASVELMGVATQVSDAGGNYLFPSLTPGSYQILAQAAGFGTLPPQNGIDLDSGENLIGQDFYLPPADNLLLNWDFEAGKKNWKKKGPVAAVSDAHSGSRALRLLGRKRGGETWVGQTLTIPADMIGPTLSFLYRFSPGESGDQFQIQIYRPKVGWLATPWIQTGAKADWAQAWIDLTPYLGQNIQVRLVLIETGAVRSTLYLDEVSLGSN